MALRNLVIEGDPLLRKTSRPVDEISPRIIKLLDDMADTMYFEGRGIGIAAPQVGVLRRVVVMDCTPDRSDYIELVNPEIISSEGEQFETEGCLSLPGESAVTCRPETVKVKAQDRNGKWVIYKGEGLKARCFCHEIDHLDGIIFTQRAAKG